MFTLQSFLKITWSVARWKNCVYVSVNILQHVHVQVCLCSVCIKRWNDVGLYFCIYSTIRHVCAHPGLCLSLVRVAKARKTVIKRNGVSRKETVCLRVCLKLPILWGVLPHILSHVTEQKKDRLNQRYVALAEHFSCSLTEYRWIVNEISLTCTATLI